MGGRADADPRILSKRLPGLFFFYIFNIAAQMLVLPQVQATTTRMTETQETSEETIKKCQTGLPISPLILGIVTAELGCANHVAWNLRSGVMFVSYEKPRPYVSGSIGVTFPSDNGGIIQYKLPHWRVSQKIRYVYLPEASFESTQYTLDQNPLASPSIQQWTAFLDSEVSLELQKNIKSYPDFSASWGLKIWHTLPPQWRTLGALRSTRNAEANGYQLSARFTSGKWDTRLGLGRMNISLDRIALNFLHPTLEVSMRLGENW